MKLVRLFLTRHFGLKQRIKGVSQVGSGSEWQSDAGANARLGLPGAIRNYAGERQANNARCKNAMLHNYVGANGLNVQGIGNLQNEVSELNRFSSLALSHRSFPLFVNADGEAYDLSGRKWSPSC